MSFVDVSVYNQNNQMLESRLVALESRLNDLFSRVDNKLAEQDVKFAEKTGQMQAQSQVLENLPSQFKAVIDENRTSAGERIQVIENFISQSGESMRAMRSELSSTQAEMARVASSTGGGPRSSNNKKLLDPKNFNLTIFDGDKESKLEWEEWKEDMLDFLNGYFPGSKDILEKAGRWKEDIDEHQLSSICSELNFNPMANGWSYEGVKKYVNSFMRKYLKGNANVSHLPF